MFASVGLRTPQRRRLFSRAFSLAFAMCLATFPLPAAAQGNAPFGQEKVETRPFRNNEVERALSRPPAKKHGHSHGKKGHKAHNH